MESSATQSKQRRGQVTQSEGSGEAAQKLLLGITLLGLTGVCAVIFVTAAEVIDGSAWTILGRSLNELLHLNKDPDGVIRISLAVGSLVVGLLSMVVLFRRITGADRTDLPHLLAADETGMVMVETESIATVASAAALRVPGVMKTRVRVAGSWAMPVQLRVTVWLSPFAEHKHTGEQVRDRATEVVQRLVGIDVTDCQVNIKTVAPNDMGRMLE